MSTLNWHVRPTHVCPGEEDEWIEEGKESGMKVGGINSDACGAHYAATEASANQTTIEKSVEIMQIDFQQSLNSVNQKKKSNGTLS